MNLFSIFDCFTSVNFSLNWLSSLLLIFYLPMIYWLIPCRYLMILKLIMMELVNEFGMLMSKKLNKINIILMISVFFMILLNNFLGLYSYIFTSSSHLLFSLSFSLIMWISYMLFGWINNANKMFIHLVPQGTPGTLMSFMVLIETISNIIRPGTLAVRLTANMIAGHLLITLMSMNGFSMMFLILILMLTMQNLLMMLELAVSMIQAYVFSVLSTLYSIESS